MSFVQITISVLALFGHLALWLAVFNRVHALGLPKWQIEILEKPVLIGLLGGPCALVGWLVLSPDLPYPLLQEWFEQPFTRVYFWLCFGVALPVLAGWTARMLRREPVQWIGFRRQRLNVRRALGYYPCDRAGHVLAHVPGNQIFDVEVNEKVFALPRLPPALDGLTIAHLSDLHFAGRLTKDFFALAVDQINAMQADLVALTGDILDKTECLPWIPEVLGRLRGRFGVYCVLGNHDMRIRDTALLRARLAEAGLTYLGGRWQEVQVHGRSLILAGNEWPWFGPMPDLTTAPWDSRHGRPPRILLAHTPDVIGWARRSDVDLMLAGHTHGGQIRFPLIGPIVSPSFYGVRFASGVFWLRPTLLHVSRGLSGLQALRINCRPELTKLVLRSREPVAESAQTHPVLAAVLALPQHSRSCTEV
jgi:predicted MPP superfamily phosphohydrolase